MENLKSYKYVKTKIISKILFSFLFLAYHTLASTQVPNGINCHEAIKTFMTTKQDLELTSYLSRVNFYNFWDEGEMVVLHIEDYLEKFGEHLFRKYFLKYSDFLKNDYLEHVYQNAVQHSSLVLAKDNQDSVNSSTFTKTTIFLTETGIRIEVRNPKIKPFPNLLQKRFFRGDNPSILKDRNGFKGRGVAHKMLIEGLKYLPRNSYIEWIDEDEIIVKIFLSLSEE